MQLYKKAQSIRCIPIWFVVINCIAGTWYLISRTILYYILCGAVLLTNITKVPSIQSLVLVCKPRICIHHIHHIYHVYHIQRAPYIPYTPYIPYITYHIHHTIKWSAPTPSTAMPHLPFLLSLVVMYCTGLNWTVMYVQGSK